MKRITVLITMHFDNSKWNFEELRQKEMAHMKSWKEEDILENFYIKAEKDGAKNIFNAEKKEQTMVALWKIGGRKWLFCGREKKEHGYHSCHGCNSYRKLNSNICCCYILGSQQLGS